MHSLFNVNCIFHHKLHVHDQIDIDYRFAWHEYSSHYILNHEFNHLVFIPVYYSTELKKKVPVNTGVVPNAGVLSTN